MINPKQHLKSETIQHTVTANSKRSDCSAKREENNDKCCITLVCGEHHKKSLCQKCRTVEILSRLTRCEVTTFLNPIGQIADKEKNDS